jgi:hypothetical protein
MIVLPFFPIFKEVCGRTNLRPRVENASSCGEFQRDQAIVPGFGRRHRGRNRQQGHAFHGI